KSRKCDANRLGRERKTLLEHGLPLLEPVLVHLLEVLDVEQAVPHLDRLVRDGRQQILLVALLHALRRQRGEAVLCVAEVLAERPPFPAWNDHEVGSGTPSFASPRRSHHLRASATMTTTSARPMQTSHRRKVSGSVWRNRWKSLSSVAKTIAASDSPLIIRHRR